MTAGCAACGHCCDPVHLDPTVAFDLVLGDPDNPSVAWFRDHFESVGISGSHLLFKCDAFDPNTRLCTAHERRPPICRGFPWYGRAPNARTLAELIPVDTHQGAALGCSYLADLPPGWRPPNQRPLIPLEVLRG